MKKIIFSLITACLLISCGPAINDLPLSSEGTVVRIGTNGQNVIITVSFQSSSGYDWVDFIGSDTCKIGQKIHIQ